MAGIEETVISAGIDVGTTTTQVIFSRIKMKNTGGFGSIPKIEIVEKTIFYRSRTYFTPLISEEEIDENKVREIVEKEYLAAGVHPDEVAMGAVIITGETSRKRNANAVVHALAELAGDFVVAAAGPNMESVLAGRGSGAEALSKKQNCVVANLDIGGGTTNICFFENGKILDTACLNIGGRLLKITDNRISYVSKSLEPLLGKEGSIIKQGAVIDGEVLKQIEYIVSRLCRLLEQAVLLDTREDVFEQMVTSQAITCNRIPDIITFSGGVADCIKEKHEDRFPFGDIGCLLGKKICTSSLFKEKKSGSASETVHATVIGAGNYSMEVSGSTIEYCNCSFPFKDIPVLSLNVEKEQLYAITADMKRKLTVFYSEYAAGSQIAFAFKGIACPSFEEIELIAEGIGKAVIEEYSPAQVLILVMESDMAKSLGQALRRRLPRENAILCIDHIVCGQGDYIDIGAPAASGKVIPVVIKTLLFSE